MTEDEKPVHKPAPASLAERLKPIQDQADKIGPVDPELDHKTISDWICENAPSGQPDTT
ncbi:MAG: hypothetical protein ABJN52_14525 [Litorimonas sp.]